MSRRRIGQELLSVGGDRLRGDTSLDEVAALLDWAEIDRLLVDISAAMKGAPGWPPLALFLDARGVVVRTVTLVDATLLPSASIRHDADARWAGHRRRKPVHSYKAHVATDRDTVLIRGVEVTTANVHDAAELAATLPDAPGDTFGDTAYGGRRSEAAIRARGGTPRVVHASTCGGPKALARLAQHNAAVSAVRGRIEKVFGTAKRSYGLRRMRWIGLARAGLQVRLAAIAYNLRRSWRVLAKAAA